MNAPFPLAGALLLLATAALRAGDLAGIELIQTKIVDLPFVPTDLKAPPDGTPRLFALSQTGEIRIIDLESRSVLPAAFMQVPEVQFGQGEQGAYSLAFHPDFASNGHFYVHHSIVGDIFAGSNTGNRVARFTASSATGGDPGTALTIFENQKYSFYHFGGTIEFGPDGLLYLAIGDDEGVGGNPQSHFVPNGKILRVDVDHPSDGRNYGIPAGNPIEAGTGLSEILMKGLRNPWRFSFDRETGEFWVADVGEDDWEEISVLGDYAAPAAPPDFGWPYYEGTAPFDWSVNYFDTELPPSPVVPLHVYGHTGTFTARSVTGGHVYRGSRFPRMQGVYFFADWAAASISGLENQGTWTARELADYENFETITTFGEDREGELYVAVSQAVYHLGDTVEGVPETLEVAEAGIDGSGYFFVSVLGTDGASLQLQRRDDLGSGGWQDVGAPVMAGTTAVRLSDTGEAVPAPGSPRRFYRVVQTLP